MSVEPKTIRANTNLYWVRQINPIVIGGVTVASASVDDGFIAFYEFRSARSFFTIATTGVGNEYTVNTLAGATIGYASGEYHWEFFLTSEESRWPVDSGTVNVVAYTAGPQDLRSHAKKTLDAIDSMLAGKATADVLKYDIQTGSGSRSVEKCTYQELISARKYYSALYAKEQAERGIRKSIIRPRFSNNNGYYRR